MDSFERKLEEAQESLGVDSHHFVPVTYTSELSWAQEGLRLLPTLILVAGYIYFTRMMQGGIGGGFGSGGGGGGAARGIFNVGKAHVTKVDKNAKNKVRSAPLLTALLPGFAPRSCPEADCHAYPYCQGFVLGETLVQGLDTGIAGSCMEWDVECGCCSFPPSPLGLLAVRRCCSRTWRGVMRRSRR